MHTGVFPYAAVRSSLASSYAERMVGRPRLSFSQADVQTYNALHGTCANPWDHRRTPGGSSGGSAAALAARLTPLEVRASGARRKLREARVVLLLVPVSLGRSLIIRPLCTGLPVSAPLSQHLLPLALRTR